MIFVVYYILRLNFFSFKRSGGRGEKQYVRSVSENKYQMLYRRYKIEKERQMKIFF